MSRLADEAERGAVAEIVEAIRILRGSPLTDPRSLVISLAVHAVLVVVVSYLALQVAVSPREESPNGGQVMKGEIEATDNRAKGEQGGASGLPDGRAADVSAEPGIPAPSAKNAAADALLAEVLPTRDVAETPSRTLPGPSTSGLGMLRAPGDGSGGPTGGTEAGGGGQGGNGPGTEFFGVKETGRSFAYVIDCSGSMSVRESLSVAKRELLASLNQISSGARFGVVFYNIDARILPDSNGQEGLMTANDSNKARVRELLAGIRPLGGTDHMLALKTAFELKPEVVFFLTDGDSMTRSDVAELTKLADKTRINVIEFGQVSVLGVAEPLKNLARQTGGNYRYVDVNGFTP